MFIKETAFVCSSPLFRRLSGSTIWGVAKALVKWAAGHHSWPRKNTLTHTHSCTLTEENVEPPGNICIATAQSKDPTLTPEPSLYSVGAEKLKEKTCVVFVRVSLKHKMPENKSHCNYGGMCVAVLRLHTRAFVHSHWIRK